MWLIHWDMAVSGLDVQLRKNTQLFFVAKRHFELLNLNGEAWIYESKEFAVGWLQSLIRPSLLIQILKSLQ